MSPRPIRLVVPLLLVGALALGQEPSHRLPPAVVQAAMPSVFKVLARRCRSAAGPGRDRKGTGFVVEVDGSPRLVTALHVVAGCERLAIDDPQGNQYAVELSKVLLADDLALLASPQSVASPPVPFRLPPLKMSARMAAPGEDLVVLGFGKTPTLQDKAVYIRAASGGAGRAADTLAGLIENGDTIDALKAQGFPSMHAPILNIHGPFYGGDSGGPILDRDGVVVGIANGGLLGGLLLIDWGFPARALATLVAPSNQDRPPAASVLCADLLSETLPARPESATTTEPPAAEPAGESVRCGGIPFTRVAEQTFVKAAASADPLSQQHVAMATTFARMAGKTIPPDQGFEIYVHGPSGATFSIPRGWRLRAGPEDCVATDPPGELQIRVHGERVGAFPLSGPASDAFVFRALDRSHGEMLWVDPSFTMLAPIARADGMRVRRTGARVLSPATPVPQLANEMYASHTFRDGMYLGVLVRTRVPTPALRRNDFYAAVVSVYLSSFSF